MNHDLDRLIRSAKIDLAPPAGFERRFWEKVLERERQSAFSRFAAALERWFPVPSPAQVFAVLALVFFLGGAGGFAAGLQSLDRQNLPAKRISVRYLSGFRETHGVPAASVSGSFLAAAKGASR